MGSRFTSYKARWSRDRVGLLKKSLWHAVLFPAPNHANVDNPLGSAFVLTVVAVFIQGLARFGYSFLVVRLLGVEANGDVAFMISVATLLVLLWPQATGMAAAKYIAMARGRADLADQGAVAACTAWSAALSAAFLGLVATLYVGLHEDTTWVGALSTGLLVLSLGAYTFVRGVRTGNNQFVSTAAWDTISSALTLALLLLVLIAGWEPVLLVPLCLGYLIFALPSWPRRSNTRLNAGTRRAVLGFTAWGSLQLLAASGLLQISVVIGKITDTDTALGLYGIAVAVATPASMLSGAMLTALAPTIARRFAAGDRIGLSGEVDRVMHTMVTIFLPVFGFLILWAEPILRILFKDRGVPAQPLLVVLLFAVSVTSFNAANLRLNGTEPWGVKALAISNVLGFLAGVGVILWLAPTMGVMGSAIGYLVGSAVSAVGPLVTVWRLDRMPWWPVMVRVLTGYALILVALWWLRGNFQILPTLLASAVFLIGWATFSYRDLRSLVVALTARCKN